MIESATLTAAIVLVSFWTIYCALRPLPSHRYRIRDTHRRKRPWVRIACKYRAQWINTI